MRRALELYPDCMLDFRDRRPWRSSADCAVISPIIHLAERVIDLGHYVYFVNDHGLRDQVLDRHAQWDTTGNILGEWDRIAKREEATRCLVTSS